MTTPAPYTLNLPDVGTPDTPCCYIAGYGVQGLHALDCPRHDPKTCPTCKEQR